MSTPMFEYSPNHSPDNVPGDPDIDLTEVNLPAVRPQVASGRPAKQWPMPQINTSKQEKLMPWGPPLAALALGFLALIYLAFGKGGPAGGRNNSHQAHSGVPPIVLSPQASPTATHQPAPTIVPSPTPKPTQPAQPTPTVAPGPQDEVTNQMVTLGNGQEVGPGTVMPVECKEGSGSDEVYVLPDGSKIPTADFVKRDDPDVVVC